MGEKENKKILVLGGTGFLGQSLIKLLTKKNFEIILFTRKSNYKNKLDRSFNNINIKFVEWNIDNFETIDRNVLGVDCIINLCGILYEKKNTDFYKIHSDLPAYLGKISSQKKIKTLIHVSALGVSEASKSKYSRSKALGEINLIDNFPKGKILRPSLLYGKGDNFFGQFSKMASFSPILPLISRFTKFQPVFVDDVAMAIINLVNNKKNVETFYELVGKSVYTFEELLKILLEIKNIKRFLLPLNPNVMMLPALFLQCFPKPPFTVDQMKLLKKDNIKVSDFPGLKELGINPTDMKKELKKIYKNN